MTSADPNVSGVIESFCQKVASFLNGKSSVFSSVAILARAQGDANTKITEAFNSSGVFGEVGMHRVTVRPAQCKALLIESGDFCVDFYENVPINQGDGGTKKGAWMLAEQALCFLHYEKIPGTFYVIMARTGGPAMEDVTKDVDSGDLTVRVYFTTHLQLPIPTP